MLGAGVFVNAQTRNTGGLTNNAPSRTPFHHSTQKAPNMSKISSRVPCWDTSSFGHPPDISPPERNALGEHLSHCGALRGPLQTLQNGADELHGLVAGRVVTTVLVLVLMVGGSWLAL